MASELLVNKITPESGTTLTLGDTGDTISFASGVLPSLESLTITGDLTVDTSTLKVDSTNNRVGVGTTSPSVTFDAEADGATVAHFNRATSDGNIIELQKDGSSVGSIGNSGTALLFNNPNANSYFAFHANNQSTGIFFQDGTTKTLSPYTARNNEFDLGLGGSKWKDLYLGGNIYLGGTTSANALDDYEEGTWTPTSGGSTIGSGIYRKIGNFVYLDCVITSNSLSITGFGGLPFSIGSSGYSGGFWGRVRYGDILDANGVPYRISMFGSNVTFYDNNVSGADTTVSITTEATGTVRIGLTLIGVTT